MRGLMLTSLLGIFKNSAPSGTPPPWGRRITSGTPVWMRRTTTTRRAGSWPGPPDQLLRCLGMSGMSMGSHPMDPPLLGYPRPGPSVAASVGHWAGRGVVHGAGAGRQTPSLEPSRGRPAPLVLRWRRLGIVHEGELFMGWHLSHNFCTFPPRTALALPTRCPLAF